MSFSITGDLEPLFEATRQLAPDLREEFIQRHVPEDLRGLLRDVLATHAADSEVSWSPNPGRDVEIAPGTRIDGFVIGGRVDGGGMGTVYRAYEEELQRFVALKTLHSRERASKEAETLARMRHPNIVPIYRIGTWEGRAYLTTELIERGDNLINLQRFLDEGDFDERVAAELMIPICDAVDAAHQQGVVHRDIKPANILVTADGTPKLTDFSLADTDGSDGSRRCEGTPGYMAPEQWMSETPAPSMDVYAIGATLGALVLRQPPHHAADFRAAGRRVSHDFETIVLTCLRTEPAARYATAGDVGEDLKRLLNYEPIKARRAGRAEIVWKWCRRKPWLAGFLALAAVSLMLLFAGGTLSLRRIMQERQRAVGFRDKALQSVGNLLEMRFTLPNVPENRTIQNSLWRQAEEALSYLEEFGQDDPTEMSLRTEGIARRTLGDARFEARDLAGAAEQYALAVRVFLQLTELAPKSSLAWQGLGGSYESLGVMCRENADPEGEAAAYGDAIAAYGRALELEPNDQKLYSKVNILAGWRNQLLNPQVPNAADDLMAVLAEASQLTRKHEYKSAVEKYEVGLGMLEQLSQANENVAALKTYYEIVCQANRLAPDAIRDESTIDKQIPEVAQLLWYFRATHAADHGNLAEFEPAVAKLKTFGDSYGEYYAACACGAMILHLNKRRGELFEEGVARFGAAVDSGMHADAAKVSNDPDLAPFSYDERYIHTLWKLLIRNEQQ